MNKIVFYVLLLFFISGSFVVALNHVSASELIENSWNTKASMNQARADLGVVSVDGKIYAIGGYTALGYNLAKGFAGTNECYDPVSDKWVILEPMPTPRAGISVVACQNEIYCMGGYNSHEWSEPIALGVNEVYDIVTNSWSTKEVMPFNGIKLQMNVINGQIFVISGYDLYMYDPVVDSWSKKNRMISPEDILPTAKFITHDFSVVMNKKIIYNFHYQNNAWSKKYTSMIYDPHTDIWSEKKTEPHLELGNVLATETTTGRYAPQRVYVLGDFYYSMVVRNRVYDPSRNTWSSVKDLPTYRTNFGVTIIDDILYVIGGLDFAKPLPDHATGSAIGPVALNEQYIPIGYNQVPNVNVPIVNSPIVNIISPLNQTYTENNVFLTFTVDKSVAEMGYSLDKQTRTSVIENTTLPPLSTGEHHITVYAIDHFGNIGISKTTTFTITSTTNSNPVKPLITYLSLAILALTLGAFTTGLFFYFKKKGSN